MSVYCIIAIWVIVHLIIIWIWFWFWIETVCSMPKAAGTCVSYTQRWWFNAKTGDCEHFLYSGCQANANNFDSSLSCQNYCHGINRNSCNAKMMSNKRSQFFLQWNHNVFRERRWRIPLIILFIVEVRVAPSICAPKIMTAISTVILMVAVQQKVNCFHG